MINAEKLLAQHRRAECVLLLIQKADERIKNKEAYIAEWNCGSFGDKQKLFRWLGVSQAAKERLIETYNKIKL